MKTILCLILACLSAAANVAAQGTQDEPLLPQEAFRLTAEPVPDGVRLTWDIAEGYYLYRDRFRFASASPGVVPGDAVFPKGKIKDDEFFGPMETYRGRVAVELPLEVAGDLPRATLEATSQGCADIGVCYPPQTETVQVALAKSAAPAPAGGVLAALSDIAEGLGGGGDEANEFLEPDQAFRFFADALDGDTLLVRWDIAEGYYLYKDKLTFRLIDGAGASLGEAALPPGETKADPLFGNVVVFHNRLEARLPLRRAGEITRIDLEVGYQGCAEAGICYPPINKRVSLDLPPAGAAASDAPALASVVTGAAEQVEPVAEQDRLAALLAGDNALVTVLAFFGFGLLLALTPCVFPMIPILSGIIAGQGSRITARKAFVLSVTYVLAMSVTYTVAGVIAGKSGENLQAALQNPWVLSVFAAVFVVLALSMFGFYELQLPSSLQSRLTELSNRQQGGSLLGVAVMGFLSALIVGPCVAPPLAGALIYIGQTGDPWLGGLALFALSMGMGAPLIAMGTLEGKYLPRAGGWMNAVKAVFGVLMLGVAIYLLDRVLPGWLILALWAVLCMVSAIYLGALEPLGRDASGFRKLWKGLGLVLLVYGTLLMLGAASGGNDMLRPLKGIAVAGAADGPGHGLAFRGIKGLEGLERELAAAHDAGQPVLLDFYADWCVSCKEMEKFTFSDPGVAQAVAGARLLQADVTANDDSDQALLKAFRLIGPPAILFFDREGRERRGYRLVGFLGAGEFRPHAARALAP